MCVAVDFEAQRSFVFNPLYSAYKCGINSIADGGAKNFQQTVEIKKREQTE